MSVLQQTMDTYSAGCEMFKECEDKRSWASLRSEALASVTDRMRDRYAELQGMGNADPEGFVGLLSLAERHNVRASDILRGIKDGRIAGAYNDGLRWWIPKDSDIEFIKARSPVHRPKTDKDRPLPAEGEPLSIFDVSRRDRIPPTAVRSLLRRGLIPGAFQGTNRKWFVPCDVNVKAIAEANRCRRSSQ